jgi:hypothetical protein
MLHLLLWHLLLLHLLLLLLHQGPRECGPGQ